MLAELALDGAIRIQPDGQVTEILDPRRDAKDDAAQALLRDIRCEPEPLPVDTWLRFLAYNRRAITVVRRRLVLRGVAEERMNRFPRRGSSFAITDMSATDWARHYLIAEVVDQCAVPEGALVLWRVLSEIHLGGNGIALPPQMLSRLQTTPVPVRWTPLLVAFERSLRSLSTQL